MANFLQPSGPLEPIFFIVFVALEGAGELKLPWDFHIAFVQIITCAICVADIADGCGKWPRGSLNKLLLDGFDEHLVIVTVFVGGHKRLQSSFHVVLEKVPGVSLFEAWHAEDVLRFLSVDEELESEGGEETFGIFMQVHGLREANNVVVGGLRIEASVSSIVCHGNPRGFCNQALSVGSLEAIPCNLIRVLAEGASWLVCEDLIQLGPE